MKIPHTSLSTSLKAIALAAAFASVGITSAAAQDFQSTRQYQTTLTELSRVLGQIHAMRVVCNGTDDQTWRDYMLNLLDVEAPDAGYLRTRLIDTFNRAYLISQREISGCDTTAIEAESELFARGRTLTENLSLMAVGETP